jgi:hypothetical protein
MSLRRRLASAGLMLTVCLNAHSALAFLWNKEVYGPNTAFMAWGRSQALS